MDKRLIQYSLTSVVSDSDRKETKKEDWKNSNKESANDRSKEGRTGSKTMKLVADFLK